MRLEKEQQVKSRIENLYEKLQSLYGTKGFIIRASKLDAMELLNSGQAGERLLALQKMLNQDPTINVTPKPEEFFAILDRLEELLVDKCAQHRVEKQLEQRIQQKMEQKYQDYVRDVKEQIIKEQASSCENAETLKRLGRLEKMEHSGLNRASFDLLRPKFLHEVIGQEKAIKSLISKLNSSYPQHVLLYGPPGVGKTTCARLVLELLKGRSDSPFKAEAPFVEVDGSTLRWDPRESSNPLLGSVHDPIYQGARRELAEEGIPEPKLGLVSEAHGGILFIDEFGEMDLYLQNKLLKVLEDKRVFFESSYYDPYSAQIPKYIKKIFDEGVPADFVLIGATTRAPEEISPAFRSRCTEVFFEPLIPESIKQIVINSAEKLRIKIDDEVIDIICDYSNDGRGANKILVDANALARCEVDCDLDLRVSARHIYAAIQNSRLSPYIFNKASEEAIVGRILGIGVNGFVGRLIEVEAIAFPAEPGKGSIRFNNSAGNMAKDSVFNATSVFRKEHQVNVSDYDIHINITGGGQVDGPSAGAAIFLVLSSAVLNRPLLQDVAITGEISIQGQVKPVGGIYQKIFGAKQAGIRKILIPYENQKDIPEGIKGVQIIPIKSIKEAYQHAFAPAPVICN